MTQPVPKQVEAQSKRADEMMKAAEIKDPVKVAETPPEVPPKTAAPATEDNWEQKYHALKGKYDAEVPMLHQQVRDVNGKLENAERFIASQSQQPQAQEGDTPKKIDFEKLSEEYPEDIVDTMKTMFDTMQTENAQLRQQVGNMQENTVQTATRGFEETMDRMVPTWREVNMNTEFKGWLAQIEPTSGLSIQDHLNNAYRNRDAQRVSVIFNNWIESVNKNVEPKPPGPAVVPQSSNASQPPAAGTTYTRAQVQAFYRDSALNRIPEEEAAKIDADIQAAQFEGRIIG